ncbi:MAG: YjbQ family protein, partial [Oxalobacteraceae bacterium]
MRQTIETISVETRGAGLYEVTRALWQAIERSGIDAGLATAFVRHTSCSLLIQENADADVQTDLLAFFRWLVPEGMDWIVHTTEGPDDMPAHI